ncbi:MAG: hypothetical protein L0387_00240 [Acidobacteria bacterium]|nr:hypothetical protein [Acidobacteriota bacterium]MCI0719476.1 hypothetical protein [Acidobacteriota bacterium]
MIASTAFFTPKFPTRLAALSRIRLRILASLLLVAIRKTLCDITLLVLHRFPKHFMQVILAGIVIIVYALHQDLWLWRSARPLVFGFVPIGLFYHACYSLLCAGLMALLVKFAWPASLDAPASVASMSEDEAR